MASETQPKDNAAKPERVLLPSGRIAGVVHRDGDVLTVRILGRSKMTFEIKACHVRPWRGGVSQ